MTSLLALPVLKRFLMAIAILTLPASALDKKDILGFWTMEIDDAVVGLRMELFFAANGTVEGRAHSEVLGETSDMHGRGTWAIKGDYVVVNGNGACAELDGTKIVPCKDDPEDDGIDSLKLVGTGAARELVLMGEEGEEPFGQYAGTTRQFTLPDLLSATGIARRPGMESRRMGWGTDAAYGRAVRGIDIFDMRGRKLPR